MYHCPWMIMVHWWVEFTCNMCWFNAKNTNFVGGTSVFDPTHVAYVRSCRTQCPETTSPWIWLTLETPIKHGFESALGLLQSIQIQYLNVFGCIIYEQALDTLCNVQRNAHIIICDTMTGIEYQGTFVINSNNVCLWWHSLVPIWFLDDEHPVNQGEWKAGAFSRFVMLQPWTCFQCLPQCQDDEDGHHPAPYNRLGHFCVLAGKLPMSKCCWRNLEPPTFLRLIFFPPGRETILLLLGDL